MSQENVEVVKRLFEAFNRADWTTVFALYSPDVVWDAWPDLPDGGTYHGHDGVRDFNRQWLSSFDHVRTELVDIVDVGDRVLVAMRQTGKGKDSGVPVDVTTPMVWTVQGGTIVRVQTFAERTKALEAVGLAE